MLLMFHHSSLYLLCNIAYLGNSESVHSNKLSTAWARLRTEGDSPTNLVAALSYQVLGNGNAWCAELPHSQGALWGETT